MSPTRRQRGEGAAVIPTWLCRLTFRHRGEVGYILGSGPFWMCDTCGKVVR